DFTHIDRSKMLAIYENFLESMQKSVRINIKGQTSLFGGESIALAPRPHYPDTANLPQSILLAMEKEVAGIYISGHPLSEYSDMLELFKVNSTMFEDNNDEDLIEENQIINQNTLSDGKIVEVAGIIALKQSKATRNNDMMCFLTLEDLFGTIEIIVFPRQMKSYTAILQTDSIIGIRGRVSLREGEAAKIVAEKIWILSKENSSTKTVEKIGEEKETDIIKKLYIKINKEYDSIKIDDVKQILYKYSGNCAVYVYDEKNEKKYLMNEKLWVNVESNILNDLEDLLDCNSIVVV
ncbi:MAG: hypothetical protein KAQ68_00065, partial [Clostridiales bacterium]|nr:hypothetical protein [Clostridiales bacterium]